MPRHGRDGHGLAVRVRGASAYSSQPVFSPSADGGRVGSQPRGKAGCSSPWVYGPGPPLLLYRLPGRLQPRRIAGSHCPRKAEGPPPETMAVHDVWEAWGIPRQAGKEEHRVLELDVLGCRVSGELGRLVLPRSVVAELMSFSAWFTAPGPRRQMEGQMFGGRWARAFQTRRELSCIFHMFWTWLTASSEGSRRKKLTSEVREEIRIAVYLLPLCVMDLRAHISPLVVASDASESGMGVCRTSSLTSSGLQAVMSRRAAQPRHRLEVGLIEVFAGIGGLRAAFEACGVHPKGALRE